jgi:capsular polysaccharide biosynthesis protein
MSEQALDLRGPVRIMWRHKVLVALVSLLGLLIGGYLAVLHPPALTSRAVVVFPHPTSSMATQVVIAGSDPVLSRALPHVSPATSLAALRSEVRARSLTTNLLSISAKGRTAAQAEGTANAVANSYVSYIGSASSPVGRITARVLEPASSASGTGRIKQLVIYALLGLVFGLLLSIVAVLAINRADRRLRAQDEIANSIGVSVLASFPVGHPVDAAGWTKLLEWHEPGAMYAWRLRHAFQQLGIANASMRNGSRGGNFSLTVVSLSSDPRSFALGPELAVFAASLGIPTALVIGPLQVTAATAALRTACAVPPSAESKRPSQLSVIVSDGGDATILPDVSLTVVVAVVDGLDPEIPDTMRTTATVLGVSAGAVTAEQLARAASSVAAAGCELTGILVADPEPTDRSTGQLPRTLRATPVDGNAARTIIGATGISTEIRR